MVRLGIPDVKNYVKKRFKNEKLLFLKSCCVGPTIQDQIEASIDDALSSDSWVDIAVRFFIKFESIKFLNDNILNIYIFC